MREAFFERIPTRPVKVGGITIGGDNPIVVQTMITEETLKIPAAVWQIYDLKKAGAEIVRVTAETLGQARALREIKEKLRVLDSDVPLVADVHHQGLNIALEAARHVEKVRINPGLFVDHGRSEKTWAYTQNDLDQRRTEITECLIPLIKVCREYGTALRIGVNHGSLSNRMVEIYRDTPAGMVYSVMEYLRILEDYSFYDTVVSLKASHVPTMIAANRLMVEKMKQERMNYPLHLGVTEAGFGKMGIIKSVAGMGTLLAEGIGDTIRVSLTEEPKNELDVAYQLLQDLDLRKTRGKFVSCPSCGRTNFEIIDVAPRVYEAIKHLTLKIAVMGCVVNGPGEVQDADYGFIGLGSGVIALYRKKELIARIPQEKAIEVLIQLIRADGLWVDPPHPYS